MIADVFQDRDDADRLRAAARASVGTDALGRISDPVLRDHIVALEIDQACFNLTLARSREAAKVGARPGHESSIFKLVGTELNQRRRDLAVRVAGPQALGWSGEGFSDEEIKATRDWLRSRGNTIEGGTSEIQLNIISKRVLALPEK
jgi:alkylation response protein AidB-like acyl-CoA dehydrogenase